MSSLYCIPIAALIALLFSVIAMIINWITDKIKNHKKYVSIKWLDEHRDSRIPVEFPSDTIFSIDSEDARTLGIKILGAYLKDDQWRVDLKIGEQGKIFTGGLKISLYNFRLFIRFAFLGTNKDMWL